MVRMSLLDERIVKRDEVIIPFESVKKGMIVELFEPDGVFIGRYEALTDAAVTGMTGNTWGFQGDFIGGPVSNV